MSLPLLGAGMATDGFDPLSIAGLQFWVDAADSATLYTDSTLTTLAVSDGDVVGGWKDKSSLGLNLTQPDSLYKPSLKFSRQNGRNGINFSEKIMKTAVATAITSPTVFVVAKNITYPNVAPYLFDSPSTNDFTMYTYVPTNKLQFSAGVTLPAFNTTTLGIAFQTTLKIASPRSGSELKFDAISTVGNVGTSSNWKGFTLGAPGHNLVSPYRLNGDIYEVLVYNSSLSGSDILLVEAYLKEKWGTP